MKISIRQVKQTSATHFSAVLGQVGLRPYPQSRFECLESARTDARFVTCISKQAETQPFVTTCVC